MKRVKTAVVGLNRGRILAGHILNFAHSLELVAVCDIDRPKAEKFARDNPAVKIIRQGGKDGFRKHTYGRN